MVDTVKAKLSESKIARWIALFLVSSTMFFAYFFVDITSPLKTMFESQYHWSSDAFGFYGGQEFFFNVFLGFLIISGIILDKMGIRFTLITSGLTMVAGALIKIYALTYVNVEAHTTLFWMNYPNTVWVACLGFAVFGIGVEMAGITVSKTIVKWFTGKELALAMGLEMAIARLGVFAVMWLSPIFAEKHGPANSFIWGLVFLSIGFLTFFIYTFMDARLDKQESLTTVSNPEDEFRISDIGKIFSNPGFLAIAGLCVLFYSAIFPFQRFAPQMLASKLMIDEGIASRYVSMFPIGAMILTPFIGYFLDKKGLGAKMMLYGAILLTISHLIFALVPAHAFNAFIAVLTIIILGIAFSLVPASMWPSVPKIVENRYLGSAYGLIFWIQNIGLWGVPMLIGYALTKANPGVFEDIAAGLKDQTAYDYTVPELIFAGFGIAAIILSFVLRSVDKKKGFGLDLPNKK